MPAFASALGATKHTQGMAMKITVHITKVIQDSQAIGSNDSHMVSRVFFSIKAGGNEYPALWADIKQTVGADFSAPLEVSKPHGYKGPIDYDAYSKAISDFYKTRCISVSGPVGMGTIRMWNNTFGFDDTIEFEAAAIGGAW